MAAYLRRSLSMNFVSDDIRQEAHISGMRLTAEHLRDRFRESLMKAKQRDRFEDFLQERSRQHAIVKKSDIRERAHLNQRHFRRFACGNFYTGVEGDGIPNKRYFLGGY